MNQEERAQFIKMTETPIPKLIGSLAVPTIISMLTTAIYNMADTFFVSKLGTSATGAVGIVFSLMAVIQAIGFTLGMGAGNVASRLLGKQNHEAANRVASTGFFAALAFGMLLTFFGVLFLDGLMMLLGATPTILPYAKAYAQYILFGAPVMCASFVLNNILRAQGRAVLSMVGITFGGVLNILLDPVFIFVLDLGISGAAIATLLSQCVSFCILLSYFFRGKSIIKLSVLNVSVHGGTYWQILKTGAPSFCRQGFASIATVVLNINAAVYGDAAVAAMSIVSRIFMFILSMMIGFGQGYQPVAGYNYGAGKYDRIKEGFWFTFKVGMAALTAMAVIGFFAAPSAIALFRPDDQQVIDIGTLAFRAQCIVLPLQPVIVVSNMTFQALGKSWQALFVSACRQGVFFLPLVLVLPQFIGLLGVQLTQPGADALTALCCLPFLYFFFREINALCKEKQGSAAVWKSEV